MIENIVFLLVGFGLLFSIIRLIKGPTVYDRVLGLDVINVSIIGIIVMLSMVFKNELFLDIAIIYAILAFIETIVFARVLEGEK